jgi:uncharacterized protein (TIGR00255 family)
MRSMTGFGAAASELGAVALRAEVRTVNHKHLQIKVRLPNEFGFLEPEVEELVKKKLDRGAVTLNVNASTKGAAGAAVVHEEAAKRYHKLLIKLAKELGIEPKITLETLLALPGVVESAVSETELAREGRLLLKVVAQALEALDAMRAVEGKSLEADLKKHARSIAKIAVLIEKRMPEIVRAHQANLTRRVEELLGGRFQITPADLAREVALLADKVDVSEELSRLSSHLAQIDAILAKTGPIGRQLDFLVQELFREANTIGSKCADAPVAHAVVEMKTSIERLREQVQNVE